MTKQRPNRRSARSGTTPPASVPKLQREAVFRQADQMKRLAATMDEPGRGRAYSVETSYRTLAEGADGFACLVEKVHMERADAPRWLSAAEIMGWCR